MVNSKSILIRTTSEQHNRIKKNAEIGGQTMSDYIRTVLLNPSLEAKVNRILELLFELKSGEKKGD